MQQKYTADPKTTQEIRAFVREFDKRFNENDPVAVAALCTENAVQSGPEGPIRGRQAIEKNMQTYSSDGIPPTLSARLIR